MGDVLVGLGLDRASHAMLVWGELSLAALTVLSLLFVTAPYGRHEREGWGPTLPTRAAWVIMESPTLIVFVPLYCLGKNATVLAPLCFLGLWLLHYIHRTLIYPLRIRSSGKRTPWLIALLGASFNTLNAVAIAPWLSHFGNYSAGWLMDPRFVGGCALFVAGYCINRDADRRLIALRRDGSAGYSIPHGGFFNWVSSPNYLGELIEWTGFALATWSLPGLAFLLYTAANLVPRAFQNHRWYRAQFADYPVARRALVPGLF